MAETLPRKALDRSILSIGWFFDGTRNNAGNLQQGHPRAEPRLSAARADDDSPYQSPVSSSFDNGLTNVARLQRLYPDRREDTAGAPAVSLYIEGVGTRTGADDDLLGLAFGIGATGLRAKIDIALHERLPQALRELARTGPAPLRSLRLDLFGYSRGAAAARDAANQLQGWSEDDWRALLQGAGLAVAADFHLPERRIRFIGLFDTVVAVSGTDRKAQPQTRLEAGLAEHAVHLVARDEHREHFALTASGSGVEEVMLPGAHVDVGGGGPGNGQEGPKLLTRPRRQQVRDSGLEDYAIPPLSLLHESEVYRAASEDAARWRAHLGLDTQQVWVDVWHQWQQQRRAGAASALPTPVLYVSAAVVLKRQIDIRYQWIALRLMQQRARLAGIAWRQDVEQLPELALPAALQPIAARLLAGEPLTQAQEALLRRDYTTQSAHWNFDALGDTALTYAADAGVRELPYRPGPGLFYINRPTVDGRRRVLVDS